MSSAKANARTLGRRALQQLRKESETMKQSKSVTKDPVCGMTVDETTAIHAERDGKTFYFCSDHCRQKFLSTPAGAKPEGKS
jgi:YHS domain-containing protein